MRERPYKVDSAFRAYVDVFIARKDIIYALTIGNSSKHVVHRGLRWSNRADHWR